MKDVKTQAIEVIRDIRIREEELNSKQRFCNEHNFELEAAKFSFAKEELRKVSSKLKSHFETGFVSFP